MSFGSRRGFPYTTDQGIVYGLALDESNVELVNPLAGGQVAPAGAKRLPPDIHRRFIKLISADQSTKTVPILTRVNFDAISIGDTYVVAGQGDPVPTGTQMTVVQKVPERLKRSVFAVDTGKIDGDQP